MLWGVLSGELLCDKGKASFFLIMSLCVWWMPEAPLIGYVKLLWQHQDVIHFKGSLSSYQTQKHTFCQETSFLSFPPPEPLYLSCRFLVQSHKIREEVQSYEFQALIISLCLLFVSCLTSTHFRTKSTSLQILSFILKFFLPD